MILITGTNLSISELPHSDMLEYQIENKNMNIKLKTIARSNTCFKIYISEQLRTDYTITDELMSKIVYFASDDELVSLLSTGSNTETHDIFDPDVVETPVPEIVEVPKFDAPKPVVVIEKHTPEEVSSAPVEDLQDIKSVEDVSLEEVNTDLPEDLLRIPNMGDDVDSLRVQLENKDKLIAQKESMIKELKQNIEQGYKTQELQMLEIQQAYEQKMADVQSTVDSLSDKISMGSLDESSKSFLQYLKYGKNSKALLRESFTEDELETIGRLNSNYTIFAAGTGDSSYAMFKQLKHYVDGSPDVVIVDFSNDNYFPASLQLKAKNNNSMGLFRDDINPVSLLSTQGKTHVIPTTIYNDIALLSADWPTVIRKIDDMAGGKPVVLLFGGINDFSVRCTVAKLSNIGKLHVFAKCSPVVLSTLYSDIQFFPANTVNIVAVDYIDVVKSILGVLSKSFNVYAVANDVEWAKLGLKK